MNLSDTDSQEAPGAAPRQIFGAMIERPRAIYHNVGDARNVAKDRAGGAEAKAAQLYSGVFHLLVEELFLGGRKYQRTSPYRTKGVQPREMRRVRVRHEWPPGKSSVGG